MNDLKQLQDYETARKQNKLPTDIKPCIMGLLSKDSPLLITDNIYAFIVGCELCRVGKTNEQIEAILTKKHIKPSKIRGILKSVLKNKYSYGCPRLEELDICIYESRFECPWHSQIPSESTKKYREKDFYTYNWPLVLSASKVVLYLAIREVERKRRYRAGSRLYVSWDELHRASGVHRSLVGKYLKALKEVGLVKYKKGQKRVRGMKGLASEVWRIIPIPKPKGR